VPRARRCNDEERAWPQVKNPRRRRTRRKGNQTSAITATMTLSGGVEGCGEGDAAHSSRMTLLVLLTLCARIYARGAARTPS